MLEKIEAICRSVYPDTVINLEGVVSLLRPLHQNLAKVLLSQSQRRISKQIN